MFLPHLYPTQPSANNQPAQGAAAGSGTSSNNAGWMAGFVGHFSPGYDQLEALESEEQKRDPVGLARELKELMKKFETECPSSNHIIAAAKIRSAIKAHDTEQLVTAVREFGNASTDGAWSDPDVQKIEIECCRNSNEIANRFQTGEETDWIELELV